MENHKPLPTCASMNPLFPAMLVLALMLLLSSCSNPLSRTGNAGTRTPFIESTSAAVYTVDRDFNPTLSLPLTASHLQVQTVPSHVLKQDMKVSVYLPAGYDIYGQYPVLYMLHGYTGDETSWMPGLSLHETADTLIAEGV